MKVCLYCHGSGKEYQGQVYVNDIPFQANYLHVLRDNLPSCEIAPMGQGKAARIRFEGGDGLVMPMRGVT